VLKKSVVAPSLLLFLSVSFSWLPSRADVGVTPGYANRSIYETEPFAFSFIGGLDVKDNFAYFCVDTNVIKLNVTTESAVSAGTLPSPNTGASYVRMRDGELHVAYAQNFAFPPSYRYGRLNNLGVFQDQGGLVGIYDAAVDSTDNLYVMASPTSDGSIIYRYEPATTSITAIVNVGGFSGGIAFDSQDRLYVAEQNNGEIIRYTQEQLIAGGLTAADGEPIVSAAASYICFDENDRLYAVTGFGNQLSMYDVDAGVKVREIAVDDASGFGIGWIGWDRTHHALLIVYSDFFNTWASSVHSIGFAPSVQGMAGTASVFRGWISAYQNFNRPVTNSGGFARNNQLQPTTAGTAIIGKPDAFDPAEGTGHVLSLGNGGSITLMFDDALVNGPGPDFAVFENGFEAWGGTYAEFAFVEVATTTNAWARFPVTTFGTNVIGPYEVQDVTLIDGLAGKQILSQGAPFDLDWLQHDPNVLNGSVDLNRIAYIRLIDVVGNGSTTDQFGKPIYDPYDASFFSPTDGFDLRAVGVIYLAGLKLGMDDNAMALDWYGYPGRTYQPQYRSGGTWFDLGESVPGTGGIHRITFAPDQNAEMLRVEQHIPFTP